METACSSEMSVNLFQATRHHCIQKTVIPRYLQFHYITLSKSQNYREEKSSDKDAILGANCTAICTVWNFMEFNYIDA